MTTTADDRHRLRRPPDLFGRDAELEVLTHVVRSSPDGDRVVLLAGDAGAGKSTLLDAAVRDAREAGQRVLPLRRGGYAAAAAALQRAAALAPDRDDSARLLVAAAGAAVSTGDLAWVEQLAASARSLTEDPALLRSLGLLVGRLTTLTVNHAAAFASVIQLAEDGADADHAAALEALALAAVVAFYSGRDEHRAAVRALRSSLPDHTDELLELWIAVVCDPARDRTAAVAALPAIIAAERHRPDRQVMAAIIAALLDETALAVRTFDSAFAVWRSRNPLPEGIGNTAALAYLEHGRWAQAHAMCTEVASVGQLTGLTHAVACANAVQAMAFAQQGDVAQARRLANLALETIDPQDSTSVAAYARRALGIAAAADGDHESAYQHYRSLFDAAGTPIHYHACYPAAADFADAASRTGHAAEAIAILDRAATRLGDETSPRLTALFRLARARLAEPDDAEAWFQAALDDAALVPYPYERAHALLAYAQWLRRRRRITQARPLLVGASEIFRRLGAGPWIAHTKAELRAAGIDVADAVPDAVADLSPQQQEIIRLAARGLTNREIAARMFLSPRTIASHLYRTFPRLGISSRAQLRDLLDSGHDGV